VKAYNKEQLEQVIIRYHEVHITNKASIEQMNRELDEEADMNKKLKTKLTQMQNAYDELDFYKEEVSKLKLIINEVTQENDDLKKEAEENKREVNVSEDASELDKLHAALKTKQRYIENIQQKLKAADNENLLLADMVDAQKSTTKELH